MSYEVRPLSLGQILDRTVQIYRTHLIVFAGIAMLPDGIFYALNAGFELGASHLLVFSRQGSASSAVTHLRTLLLYLIYPLLVAPATAATNSAIFSLYREEPFGVLIAYRQLGPSWWRCVRLRFAGIVMSSGVMLLLLHLFFGGSTLYSASKRLGGSPGLVSLLALSYVFAFWMGLRYSLSVPAMTSENLGVRAALKRSVSLTRNSRGRIFVAFLVYATVATCLFAAELLLLKAHGLRSWESGKRGIIVYTIALWFGRFLLTTLTHPLFSIAVTLFYIDQRVRKEGFDIEWMMERANLIPLDSFDVASGAAVPPRDAPLG